MSMKIEDQVGKVSIVVGQPNMSHVSFFTADYDGPTPIITVHYSDWQLIKKQVDKMFDIATSLLKAG